jgi:hypothetical protein
MGADIFVNRQAPRCVGGNLPYLPSVTDPHHMAALLLDMFMIAEEFDDDYFEDTSDSEADGLLNAETGLAEALSLVYAEFNAANAPGLDDHEVSDDGAF